MNNYCRRPLKINPVFCVRLLISYLFACPGEKTYRYSKQEAMCLFGTTIPISTVTHLFFLQLCKVYAMPFGMSSQNTRLILFGLMDDSLFEVYFDSGFSIIKRCKSWNTHYDYSIVYLLFHMDLYNIMI